MFRYYVVVYPINSNFMNFITLFQTCQKYKKKSKLISFNHILALNFNSKPSCSLIFHLYWLYYLHMKRDNLTVLGQQKFSHHSSDLPVIVYLQFTTKMRIWNVSIFLKGGQPFFWTLLLDFVEIFFGKICWVYISWNIFVEMRIGKWLIFH